ncbi:hypothetical protein L6164_030640 [Bauhinia variegata]|uniref:Uncharacterized protein n=1 Tax=Bauhinia variegata TaxID=167791 RepID=A0ACB9LD49_BAUVA|nr:hypothetical protein L6164_030640 [Bauhinia variegata]
MEAPDSISYLTQREAAEIDDTLMGPLGFSVDQLMELAGLSVATSIAQVYKPSEWPCSYCMCQASLCWIGCLARITVNPFLSMEDLSLDWSKDFDVIIDAMFGFSFYGTPRPPFDDLIKRLVSLHNSDQVDKERSVIISIDIPSGWHVEEGDFHGEGIKPDILVSLTAPKLCAKKFSGTHHFLGALRENYISPEFLEEQVEVDPIKQFYKWFDNALTAGLREPNAMALSTVGKDGKPSSRMVLLKGVDKDGFVWYTNYESRKARELSENPHASLLFYWDGPNSHVILSF